MSDEHFTRAPPIECRLMSASMEIDDDDEDVIQVSIEVSNEDAMPIGGLDIFIQTSDNKKVESDEGISSLGPGLTRNFTFEFPLQKGTWTFMLRSPNAVADLGPYDHDFTYKADKGRVYNNNIGSGMFTDAFTNDLDDFGKVEERGVIDASKIKMTSYFGENSAGGATAITAGSAPAEEESAIDAPRTPPWEKSNDPLLSTPIPITQESAQPSDDLLSFSKQVSEPQPDLEQPVETAATPPELPITAATPPSLPPSAPPTQPPSSPPSEKPTGKPTGPPTGPPSAPPSEKPTSPPTGKPTGPPTGPPSSPPSEKPTGKPTGPPTGPPSGKPTGPPTGPPSGKPTGKPTGPPTGPPSGKPKSKKPTRPPM